MSVAFWRRSGSMGTIRTQAAVVGGGISGLSAALAFERAGYDSLIIERHDIGGGASSRNAGFLMRGAADNYEAAIKDLGRPTAKLLWRWTEENLDLLRQEGVESLSTYRRVPSCLLALTDEEARQLRASIKLMREDGFETSWIESGTDKVWKSGTPIGALVNPHDGSVNPVELLRLLAAKLRRPPLLHQEVASIELDSGGVRLRTADATIIADRAIVCLNAFTPLLLPATTGLITPRRGQMLAFRTERPLLDMSYYAHHGYEYFRQAAPDTVVLGGCRKAFADVEVGYEERTTEQVQRALEVFAEPIFGPNLNVFARWSGTMGFTDDGLPLVGPVDERGATASESPLWICGGYTGHGMSMGFKTARDAVESMLLGRSPAFPLSRIGQ